MFCGYCLVRLWASLNTTGLRLSEQNNCPSGNKLWHASTTESPKNFGRFAQNRYSRLCAIKGNARINTWLLEFLNATNNFSINLNNIETKFFEMTKWCRSRSKISKCKARSILLKITGKLHHQFEALHGKKCFVISQISHFLGDGSVHNLHAKFSSYLP